MKKRGSGGWGSGVGGQGLGVGGQGPGVSGQFDGSATPVAFDSSN
jgi:hypothetical protein